MSKNALENVEKLILNRNLDPYQFQKSNRLATTQKNFMNIHPQSSEIFCAQTHGAQTNAGYHAVLP